ncbi:MAG: hypothetical protein ACLVAV_08675 [Clostridium sp.]
MKKKRIMAAGLAVIMAFTGTGCQKILKGRTSRDNVKGKPGSGCSNKRKCK